MPAWISVYCAQPIGQIALDTLSDEIAGNDFWTLAEQYDVDECLVDPALAALRFESMNHGFRMHYRCGDERPLVIHFWETSGQVEEEILEVLEVLKNAPGANALRISRHMQHVKSVVGIELGVSQLHDMGIVFAYEIARWFGTHRSGFIKSYDDNWCTIEDGGYVSL